jgi:hypothetical protein
MTTYIFRKYNLLKTGVEGGHKYLTTKIFYGGLEFSLPIFFKDKIQENKFTENSIIAVKGQFKEEVNPLTINLFEAEQVEIPNEENWKGFFTNYFIDNNVETFSISEYLEGYTISTSLENYYIWADISKDKLKLNKLEFGRFLPLEKAEYKRKSTSWTKGVFINQKDNIIEFMQTSWDGEEGNKFEVKYSTGDKLKVIKFLSIPFYLGWTEFDYRLGKGNFYKSSGQTKIDGEIFENKFTLLDMGEQDIPFLGLDKLSQWTRTKWADSFINNFRRHIDKTEIEPINQNNS